MNSAAVKLLDGNTFMVSDERGDVEATATDPSGFFSFDTRYLSRWVLSIDGARLTALSVDDRQYYESTFFCVPGTAAVYLDAKVSVARRRWVCDGFREHVAIANNSEDTVDLRVRLDAGSDFADLFDVKNATAKKGTYVNRIEDGRLVPGYQRETFHRQTVIHADQPAQIDEHGLTFTVRLRPKQEWLGQLHVTPTIVHRGRSEPLVSGWRTGQAERDMATELQRWRDHAPTLRCDWDPADEIYARSLTDLAALRFNAEIAGPHSMPAAGLPWFMTMFGRDAILTSL